MKIFVKKDWMLPVLYSLPLKDNGAPIPEHQNLMQELLNNKPLYDHLGTKLPDGEYLVIFYDEYDSSNPQVVKAFLGKWEYIGYTFETDQQYGYKFTSLFEVEVFPQESDLAETFQNFKPMFTKYGQTKNLSIATKENNYFDKSSGSEN